MAVGTYALTTLASLKADLGISSSDNDAILESYIDRATAIIESYTDRKLVARDHYEWRDGDGSRTILLDEYPVSRVMRVAYGFREAFSVDHILTSDLSCSISVDESEMVITRVDSSGATTTTTFDFSASLYNTTNKVATQLKALESGTLFSTTVGERNVPSTYLHRIAGVDLKHAGGPFEFTYVSEADAEYRVDFDRGTVYLRRTTGSGFASVDRVGFPATQQSIQVHYRAGYETVPADLAHACNTIARRLFRERDNDPTMSSESLGDYSYTRMSQEALFAGQEALLAAYKRVR